MIGIVVIAFTSSMVDPKLTEKGHFLYQRIFADEKFVAAGQLVIPGKGEKPKKSSKDNTYVGSDRDALIQLLKISLRSFILLKGSSMSLYTKRNSTYLREECSWFLEVRLCSFQFVHPLTMWSSR